MSVRPAQAPTGELPWIEDGGSVPPKDARALTKIFLGQLRLLEEGTPEYQYARNTLIEMNVSLVRFAARRFSNRGSGEMEDIVQVGAIGLIKAIDRFDLSREVEFTTFAIPYILGEIKRFFRDTTWAVHVPRRLQELRIELAQEQERFSSSFGRNPSVPELAEHLGLNKEDVIEGLVAANGYTASSLDTPHDIDDVGQDDHKGRSPADTLGHRDAAMDLVEDFATLGPLLDRLDDRDRQIIELRFGQEHTQSQIGDRLGISQMHVSRLLSHALAQLRAGMLTER